MGFVYDSMISRDAFLSIEDKKLKHLTYLKALIVSDTAGFSDILTDISNTAGEEITDEAQAQGKPYGSLAKIRMNDGSVLTDMKDTNKQAQVIEIAKIDKIFYYACDFFYTKEIGNQVGRPISKVTMNMYKKDKNGKRKLTKKAQSVDGASFVDDSYYTFENGGNYVPGVITRQTQNSGKFDASSYSDVLFKVIHENGNLSSMIGKTGNEISAKIREIMGNKNNRNIRFFLNLF